VPVPAQTPLVASRSVRIFVHYQFLILPGGNGGAAAAIVGMGLAGV